MYALIEGVLYRKSYLGPSLLCIGPNQAKDMFQEVHKGSCALHSGYRTIVAKVMRIGYYWPTIHSDAAKIVRTCQSCQQHAPVIRAPRHTMIPITVAWLFSKWAIDICRSYYCVLSDNGTQFEGKPFRSWCQELNIKQSFTLVAHPQANGETPFSLVYGTEAVIPFKLMVPMKRIRSFDESSSDEGLRANLDILEERREIATIREAINKQKISKYYDKRVKPMSFRIGD
ncbi:uncharacterized protein [Rutidosis leptorrhynchoides]|uniref:uncharacterized protein n=1 Tax=Rutidosis leptorrhynchoides TaxID=125765 RepID=UPI003A997E01